MMRIKKNVKKGEENEGKGLDEKEEMREGKVDEEGRKGG